MNACSAERGQCCLTRASCRKETSSQVPHPEPSANPRSSNGTQSSLTCAALATGMKCLPQATIPFAKGNILHDWHAEVLAIRAFNRFLVDECAALARKGTGSVSDWVKWKQSGTPPFQLQDDVELHMYCSEAPCGDASMELTMREQVDATPWPEQQTDGDADADEEMLGRGHFDRLGLVRRKPARPDAPATLSKSCSDKLALKQCTGLLSGVVSRLIGLEGCYLKNLVLPESQYVHEACERSFSGRGRMAPLVDEGVQDRWRRAGYRFRPFEVRTTRREFSFSRRSGTSDQPPVPSNLSALITPKTQEILVNGVRQGRKQLDPQGASCASRRSLWSDVAGLVNVTAMSYAEAKLVKGREMVKRDVRELALKGWKRNLGDEDWYLEAGER